MEAGVQRTPSGQGFAPSKIWSNHTKCRVLCGSLHAAWAYHPKAQDPGLTFTEAGRFRAYLAEARPGGRGS